MREQEGCEDKVEVRGGLCPWLAWYLPIPVPLPWNRRQPHQGCGSLSMVLTQGSWDSSILSSLSQQWLWSSLSQKLQTREEPWAEQSVAKGRRERRQRSALRDHQELEVILKNLQLPPKSVPSGKLGKHAPSEVSR